MAILTRDDLRTQLRRREIVPVYVLFGAETYLRDLAAKTIADMSFSEGDFRDFNESEFSLNTADGLRAAVAAAEQLPMMSNRRVVRINDVRVSSSGQRDTLKEDDEKALAAFLDDPPASCVVIFVADELDKRRKIAKLLTERATAVEFAKMTDAELTKWARDKIRDAGSEADETTIQRLVGVVGDDVRRLTNEIQKISAAALPDRLITADLVDSLVNNSRELTNFELTDHLLAGRKEKALAVLDKILNDGAEPLALLGLISYNFRRLLMAKEMMSRGVDRREVANVLKMRYSGQEAFLAAARRSDTAQLAKVIKKLANTDLAIKTSIGGGPSGARMAIEMLVCDLATLSGS